jgi:prepilin peptidase CpaA
LILTVWIGKLSAGNISKKWVTRFVLDGIQSDLGCGLPGGSTIKPEYHQGEMDSGVWKETVVSVSALGLATWAGWLDWRIRKIPNWLTVPALPTGLILAAVLWGWTGVKTSLEGAGISLGVLLPFVLVRGLGAGDWKFMGALGAFLGPQRVIVVLFGTVLIAGIMSVVEVVRQRKVMETLHNLWVLFVAYSTFHVNSASAITLDNPGLLKIPFGVAAALSTGLFFVIMSALRFFHKLG